MESHGTFAWFLAEADVTAGLQISTCCGFLVENLEASRPQGALIFLGSDTAGRLPIHPGRI